MSGLLNSKKKDERKDSNSTPDLVISEKSKTTLQKLSNVGDTIPRMASIQEENSKSTGRKGGRTVEASPYFKKNNLNIQPDVLEPTDESDEETPQEQEGNPTPKTNKTEQEQKKTLLDYLMAQDFTKDIDMIELSQLDFDLTEEEDEAFLQKEKSTQLKLMKVLLFNMGMIEKKVQMMTESFKEETRE